MYFNLVFKELLTFILRVDNPVLAESQYINNGGRRGRSTIALAQAESSEKGREENIFLY